jgi:hypothetical protein
MSNTITVNGLNCTMKSLPAIKLTADILGLSVVEGTNLKYRVHGADRGNDGAVMVLSMPNNKQAYELGIIPGEIVDGVQQYHPRLDVYSRGQGIVDQLQFPPFEYCQKAEDYLDRFTAIYRVAELKQFCDAQGLAYEIVATETGELAIDVADAGSEYVQPELAVANS